MGVNGGLWDSPQPRDETATQPIKPTANDGLYGKDGLSTAAIEQAKAQASPAPIVPPGIASEKDQQGVIVRGVNDEETLKVNDAPTPPAKPIVTLTDGTQVDADTYFAAQNQAKEQEVNVKEARLDGILGFLEGNPNLEQALTGNAPTQQNNQTPDANDDLFKPIALAEDADETEITIANQINQMGETFNTAFNKVTTELNTHKKNYTELEDFVSDNHLEGELRRVSAVFNVDRDAIIQKSRETRIGNPEVIAKMILGEQAQQAKLEEAAKTAQEERVEDAGKIAGVTSRQGANETDKSKTPGRGVKNWTKEEVSKAYNFLGA